MITLENGYRITQRTVYSEGASLADMESGDAIMTLYSVIDKDDETIIESYDLDYLLSVYKVKEVIRCLPVSVFREANDSDDLVTMDYTNGGISGKYSTIYLPCKDGFIDVSIDDPRLCKVVKREMFSKTVVHIEPYKPAEHIGWMSGGNFAYSSDTRFSEMIGFYGAVSIHDRQETQEMYDALSR